MSSMKFWRAAELGTQPPFVDTARRTLALGLRGASACLARVARRLARPRVPVRRALPQFEFYAEAGAPEGALYLDGKLVGWINGVQRL